MGHGIDLMRILVLGGTRFIGRLLVQRLSEKGHHVTVCSRGNRRPLFPASVTTIWGNRQDVSVIGRAFATGIYDYVVDNIAHSGEEVFKLSTIGGNKIGNYMVTSTAWVYLALCPEEGQVLTEDMLPIESLSSLSNVAEVLAQQQLPEVTQQYVRNKIAVEAAAYQMTCPVTIVRPSMVAGRYDHNNRIEFYVQRVLDGAPIILVEGCARLFQLTWVEDLVRAMVSLIESNPQHRAVYNVATPDNTSVLEIVAIVEAAIGHPIEKILLTRDKLRAIYPDYETYEPFAFTGRGYYDATRFLSGYPGFRFTPNFGWIKDTITWILDNRPEAVNQGRRKRERDLIAKWELTER